ncbi:Proteasome-activating nucleotidase [Candidatus Lokiarchaeum ossiferum]|uniref:Proteasome-activating nucleotidase n=1 Tax=Candidatus Lokiarchaeum ossiferum TaxID=2951803 RepID=A0ABY6HPD9_9ARCH|nr:Proteasome-activating nucleotidase [Candidatus Lokiarchaeum sp. B-35]
MPRSKATQYVDNDKLSTFEPNQLTEEIRRLRQMEKLILRKKLAMEMKLQNVLADRDMYKRKFLEAQTKLEQLNLNPLPVAVVEKLITEDENRAVVRLISGQMFVCHYDPNLAIHEGDNVALHQRSMSIMEVLPSFIDPNVVAMELMTLPDTTYEEIGGLSQEIMEMREVIELSLSQPEVFKEFNISPPRGVLLYGPPGTGKTLLAKATANGAQAKFLKLAAPELVQKFIGEGARLVREIFKKARDEKGPVIVFVDEIDAIAAHRTAENQSGEREVNRTLMQLLAEMDGFENNDNIRLIAATNRIDILDPAILRPGRFDRIIELPLPNEASRQAIFKIHLKKTPKYGIHLEELAQRSDELSGADIKAVCMEASMIALRDHLNNTKKARKRVLQKDLLKAIENFKTKRKIQSNPPTQSVGLYA